MQRKTAIYIRTSSEAQGERASPREQETYCRSLAQEKELTVIHIYRDIEKYRVKNKLVEPSGLRSDRPGLLAMLRILPGKPSTQKLPRYALGWRRWNSKV